MRDATMPSRIVCLCGSMRYKDELFETAARLTGLGFVVLAPFATVAPEDQDGNEFKQMLDKLHREKIDMSEFVMVVIVDGYVGQSTRNEIQYASSRGNRVEWEVFDSTKKEANKTDTTSAKPGMNTAHTQSLGSTFGGIAVVDASKDGPPQHFTVTDEKDPITGAARVVKKVDGARLGYESIPADRHPFPKPDLSVEPNWNTRSSG